MILRTIWERYLFGELIKIFLLFLIGFFLLYTMMDYSMHMQEFTKTNSARMLDILLYSGSQFIKRLDLLLPLALLIASIKVLCSLNKHHELLAFQIGGIKLQTLMRPFFLMALFCSCLIYCNFQFFLPSTMNYIDEFQHSHFKKRKKSKLANRALQVLPLEDGSRLVYQSYHLKEETLEDVYWIISADEVYAMQSLSREEMIPVGTFVDHLKRSDQGLIEKVNSYTTHSFPEMKLTFHAKSNLFIPFENRSISDLLHLVKDHSKLFIEKEDQIKTQLYFKLMMPLIAFVAILACIPICVKYSRNLSMFYIYTASIFGIIVFFAVIDACVILGENQVINPLLAIFTLPIILFIFFGKKYLKLC